MKRQVVLALTILALCSVGFAESPSLKTVNPQQEAAATAKKRASEAALLSPTATIACSYNFTSGSGNTYLKYCVTVNGNITEVETPLGHPYLGVTSSGEGYGVCDATAIVEYHDYAGWGDSGNWGSPFLLSQSATSVKIARTTSDGIWTLTQTITQVAASSSIQVVMTLKNNTAAARDVYLVRYADVDADASFLNNFDATQNSAAGWNSHGVNDHSYGLQLQNVGKPQFGYWNGFAQNVFTGPNACAFAFNSPGAVMTTTDGSLVMAYVDTMPAHGSKTVTLSYRGF